MITKKVHECIKKAMNHQKVKASIEKRENNLDKIRIEEVKGKIIRQRFNDRAIKLLVRVSFDFMIREENSEIKEDIQVHVLYEFDKETGTETYKVKNPEYVHEID